LQPDYGFMPEFFDFFEPTQVEQNVVL